MTMQNGELLSSLERNIIIIFYILTSSAIRHGAIIPVISRLTIKFNRHIFLNRIKQGR